MATESIVARLGAPVVPAPPGARFSRLSDYWALTKPEVNS